MYVIIAGGGRMGAELAKRLAAHGNDVVMVEKDERRAHELAAGLDVLVIHGNSADVDSLKDAGVDRADVLIALTPYDEVNLMTCELAKKMGVSRVVARVNEEKHARMFEEMGVDAAVSLVKAATVLFEKAVNSPGVYGLLDIGEGKGEAVEVTVGRDSKLVGKTVKDVDIPKDCVLAMIYRGGELIIPRGDTEIWSGDLVTLVGKPNAVSKMMKSLRGT